MKISIVTISYNQAKFLEQAICSVINQDYPDIEYIVVDPGSTDGSRDIIERYRKKIDKIIYEPDQGPADGLNKGFKNATGSIYGFLNADDYFLQGAIKKVAQAFLSNPNIDVFSGHAYIANKEGKILRRFFSRRFSVLSAVYGTATLAQQSTFFKGSSYRKVGGFNQNNRIDWDGEFWIDLGLNNASFGRINEMLSVFRIYSDSISIKKRSSEFKEVSASANSKRIFRKVMKRDRNKIDAVIKWIMKIKEYMMDPRIFVERILKGHALDIE